MDNKFVYCFDFLTNISLERAIYNWDKVKKQTQFMIEIFDTRKTKSMANQTNKMSPFLLGPLLITYIHGDPYHAGYRAPVPINIFKLKNE